jgi:quercetin dioxygenase-like cupin family protein
MKKTCLVGVAAVLVGVGSGMGLWAQIARSQYVTAAEAVKFAPLDPSAPGGVNLAVLSGSPQGSGPVTLFLRIPKGPAPVHTHSEGYYGVVVRGQAKHWPAGAQAAAEVLNPGSHWYQPGKAAHGDECLSDQCLLLIQMEGPYDFAAVTP